MTGHDRDPELPSAAAIEAEHQAEMLARRLDGHIARLEAQMRAAHATLNQIIADAGDGPAGDRLRYAADRLRPHLAVPPRPAGGESGR